MQEVVLLVRRLTDPALLDETVQGNIETGYVCSHWPCLHGDIDRINRKINDSI